MDTAFWVLCLIVFGLILGSFAGATVWRLRAWQLVADKKAKQPYDKAEYRRLVPLTQHRLAQDRSRCLHCEHELQAIDLVPLVSWLSTMGRCRYCSTRIGWFEPLMEIGMVVLLLAIYLLWPYHTTSLLEGVRLGAWLLAAVPLLILFAYDFKWFLLPSFVTYGVILLGAVVSTVAIVQAPDSVTGALSIAGSVLILSGLYLVLYLVSRGRWVGRGDIELGLGLALLLADWRLAFIALFAANFIGVLVVLPGMVRGNVGRTTEVQFGPLLIAGTVVALLAGQPIITWYMGLL